MRAAPRLWRLTDGRNIHSRVNPSRRPSRGAPRNKRLLAASIFALRQARLGRLLRSTGREDVGSGDLYAVTTTHGVYILIRREKSDGTGGFMTTPRRDVHEDKVRYLVLPPALVRL
jgi:hypothetical protein